MFKYGSPFERGAADYYYGRSFDPHYYKEKSNQFTRVDIYGMTDEQIQEYKEGWDEVRLEREQKDWGYEL